MSQYQEKYKQGKEGEYIIDGFMIRRFDAKIERVEKDVDYLGIDRYLDAEDFGRVSIEYKTDLRAGETNNLFIEIEIRPGVRGWAYTCTSQLLAFFIPGKSILYITETLKLRKKLKGWIKAYPIKHAPNGEHQSSGVCIPIKDFENELKPKVYYIEPMNYEETNV